MVASIEHKEERKEIWKWNQPFRDGKHTKINFFLKKINLKNAEAKDIFI